MSKPGLENQSGNRRVAFFLLSFFSAILAMLSKETAYTLPLAIVLYELFFMREKSGIRRFMLLFGVGASVVVPLLFYFTGKMPTEETTTISRTEYLFTQFTVIPVYMRLLILPIHQNLDYDVAVVKTLADPSALFGLGVIIAVLAAGVLLFPRHRLLSFGIFWFFLTLMVESSIIPIRDLMFEHRLYLPMVGFCFIFIGLINEARSFFSHPILRFAGGIFIFILAVSTYARNEVWKDEITLWNDCVIKAPAKPRAYLNRGLAYHKQGMFDEAMRDYETDVRLMPDDWKAWSNMGAILETRGEYDKAITTYTRAIDIGKGKGTDVFFSRATVYTKKGMYAEAIHDLDTFIQVRTDVAQAYYNRGCLRRSLQNPQGAITDFTQAIALDSLQGDYFFDRGVLYQQAAQFDEAMSDYDKAIQRRSHGLDSYINKGFILNQRGAYKEAVEEYTLALQYDPNSIHVLNDRGMTLYKSGEYGRALSDLNKAVQLDSLNPILYRNRAMIQEALGEKANVDEDRRKAELLLLKRAR